jgi:hypothetical protein
MKAKSKMNESFNIDIRGDEFSIYIYSNPTEIIK